MESHEDFSNLLHNEVDENFENDNPDGTGADLADLPEVKEGDSLLVHLVRQYPILYDKSLPGYKSLVMRENCWVTIGQVMNEESASCAKRWGQLRENFSRERRKRAEEERSGSGPSKRKGFSLYTDMTFLEKHIQQRRTITNVSFRSASKARASLRPPMFVANDQSFANFHPLIGRSAAASPFSTVEIPIEPPCTPPSYIPSLTPPPSSSHSSPPPEISPPKSPPNTRAPTSALSTEIPITPDITLPPKPTLPPRLLTPTSSWSTPTTTPSPDTFMSSPSNSSTSLHSTTSPSYPYSPSPPYYPRATPSPVLNSNMNSQFRRSDPCSLRNAPTTRSFPRLQTPSSAGRYNDVLEQNIPSPLRHEFAQPTACFNKDLVKSKKIDPVESSFLSLSSALQNHLMNPARTETEKKTFHPTMPLLI